MAESAGCSVPLAADPVSGCPASARPAHAIEALNAVAAPPRKRGRWGWREPEGTGKREKRVGEGARWKGDIGDEGGAGGARVGFLRRILRFTHRPGKYLPAHGNPPAVTGGDGGGGGGGGGGADRAHGWAGMTRTRIRTDGPE